MITNLIIGFGMFIAFNLGWYGRGQQDKHREDEQHDELQED